MIRISTLWILYLTADPPLLYLDTRQPCTTFAKTLEILKEKSTDAPKIQTKKNLLGCVGMDSNA